MIAGTTPAILLVALRLPPGFEAVDPDDLPLIGEEIVRIELVDAAGNVRPWQWSDIPIPWEEAAGWRVADDGIAEPCEGCGRLTRWLVRPDGKDVEIKAFAGGIGKPDEDRFPLCEACQTGGFD